MLKPAHCWRCWNGNNNLLECEILAANLAMLCFSDLFHCSDPGFSLSRKGLQRKVSIITGQAQTCPWGFISHRAKGKKRIFRSQDVHLDRQDAYWRTKGAALRHSGTQLSGLGALRWFCLPKGSIPRMLAVLLDNQEDT